MRDINRAKEIFERHGGIMRTSELKGKDILCGHRLFD